MIEKLRKTGIISKGILYSFIGILNFLSALEICGKISGKNEVFDFFEKQIFGNIILIIIAIGILSYSIWRIYASFYDGKNKGNSKTGILQRIGFCINGLIYGFLSISIFLKSISRSSNDNKKEEIASNAMDSDFGVIFMYLLSIILVILGIYRIYNTYQKKFLDNLNVENNIKPIIEKVGVFGFITIGFSFIIYGCFVGIAAYQNNANVIKGIKEMFIFLHSFSWGNQLMGLTALGFVSYGIYQYFLAIYDSSN